MFFSYKDLFRPGERIALSQSVFIDDPSILSEHKHDFFEIAYIVEGSGYHILNGQKTSIRKNDLLFLTPRSTHTYQPRTNSTLKWVNCMFLPDVIDEQLFDILEPNHMLKFMLFPSPMFYDSRNLSEIEIISNNENVNFIFSEMQREYEHARPGYQETLKSYLQILLIKIFRAYYIKETPEEKGEKPNELMSLVLNYLEENSETMEYDVATLSKRTFYSPRYFQNLFKQQTGITLNQFIRQKRIETACDLLLTTDLPVLVIMERIGMSDTKSFYALFKRVTGTTPAQYREGRK
ncbi:MAG: helix-turn-helix domain-containing protein [Clostridia bacterium]|nr:helix-turn-helix domain-containing protein [Clostridia bacterium]